MKYILIFVCLFSITLSEEDYYIPMEKESKYGDDVCGYEDKDGHHHVKPCEKGKYCVDFSLSTSYLEICQDLPEIKTLSNLIEQKCSTSFECESDLTCDGSSCRACTVSGNLFDHGEYLSYSCDSDSHKGSGYCESNTYDSNNILTSTKYSTPEKYKTCGKLTIAEFQGTTGAGVYYVKLDEYDYIGTVQDGEYVTKMELCESGFALYFYYGGNHKDPRSSTAASALTNTRYLRCVTPLAINRKNTGQTCSINYKIKDGEPLNYNVEQLTYGSTYYNDMDELCNKPYIKVMSEKYREYSKSITEEERKTCGDLDGNDKYTCENNGLIKSWFAYKNPEIYIHYNGRKKLERVFDYLIQKKYPKYSFSQFLNLRLLSLLFLILI
jgi:hypothetical protein